MKSTQIELFMLPEDVAELDKFIKEQGLLIVADCSDTSTPHIIQSLVDLKTLIALITTHENLSKIKMQYIKIRKQYMAISIQSPVIEYRKSVIKPEKNISNNGRIYYDKYYYTDSGEAIEKDTEITEKAQKIFKWTKKYLKQKETVCL